MWCVWNSSNVTHPELQPRDVPHGIGGERMQEVSHYEADTNDMHI